MAYKRLKKTIELVGELTVESWTDTDDGVHNTLILNGQNLEQVIQEAWGLTEGEVTIKISMDIEETEQRGYY